MTDPERFLLFFQSSRYGCGKSVHTIVTIGVDETCDCGLDPIHELLRHKGYSSAFA
ncbi:MAG: hypothetical protein ACK50J_23330 [Planctomyces sp.]